MSSDLQIIDETRERFIPISRQEIVADLLAASHWNTKEQKQFGEFCQIFTALYHYKFHSHLEELKHCYTPFNPDNDITTKHEYSDEEKQELSHTLTKETLGLLNNANYEELTVDALNRAMSAESYYGLSVSVNLDDFDKLIVYYRGSATQVEYKRNWKKLFLFKDPVETPIYKRLFLLLKLKDEERCVQEWVAIKGEQFEKKIRKQVRKSRQNLPENVSEQHVFLKLFKNIPRTDLEMLFPNRDLRLTLFDKIRFAITGGGGTLYGIIITTTKVMTALANPIALVMALVGFLGIIFRQIMNIFTQRTKYMMVLSQNLYFHNLDNNFGVVNFLVDMAEEEEGKEAILAYYFLQTQSDKNFTKEELDREIEKYLLDKYGVDIDFEVDDGLRKLRQEGILIEQDNGILKVLDLQPACACLDKQWDAFFNPNETQ